MHAMQYEITLPADYDMKIIHHRVATKGPLLDDFAGLGLKAYLIRERGVDASPVNQYAPFYLWNSIAGMNRFLWGPGFRGLCTDFGRPRVWQWTGLAFRHGPAYAATPRAATRRTTVLSPDDDAATVVQEAIGELESWATTPGVHSTAVVVATSRWELVRFTLWEQAADPADGIRYQVLHLSRPGLDALGSDC